MPRNANTNGNSLKDLSSRRVLLNAQSSAVPQELATGRWQLQPEYYAERKLDSAMEAIIAAKTESDGNVFLVTDDGAQFNLGFTDRYGVCKYQNEDTGDFRYAYTESNLREQVRRTYTSYKRVRAVVLECFGIRADITCRVIGRSRCSKTPSPTASRDVEWLETDDFSYTEHGRG